MTPFIRKEFRSLAPPAGLILAAALVGAWGSAGLSRSWAPLAQQVAAIAFLVGTPLMAALSFGDEFHHRTMTLLLSEPVSRARVWVEKWLVVVTVVGVLTGVELGILSVRAPGDLPLVSSATYVVLVVCSAPLWTLVTRSTIGGFAFTGAAIVIFEFGMNYVSYRMTGARLDLEPFGYTPAFQAARVVYALATLWLGWRVFARFEAVGSGFGAASSTSGGWAVLRARRGAATGNLIRKELMLQRPTFLLAAAFIASWVVAFASFSLQWAPAYRGEAVFDVLLAIYVPVVVVLAGTISAGEDASLGTRPWHLTLPVSARWQWTIKLVVSVLVGLALALVLPAVLTTVADIASAQRVHQGGLGYLRPSIVIVATSSIVLAFWASTLVGDTVKASVLTGGAILAIGLCARFATSWGASAGHHAPWVVSLVTPLHVSQQTLSNANGSATLTIMAAVGVTAICQSLMGYRRIGVSTSTLVRMSLVLLAVAFVAGFCVAAVDSAFGISLNVR